MNARSNIADVASQMMSDGSAWTSVDLNNAPREIIKKKKKTEINLGKERKSVFIL